MGVPLVRRELRHRPGRAALLALTVAVAVSFTTAAFGFSHQLSLQLDPRDTPLAALGLPEGTVVVAPRTSGATTATSIDAGLVARIRSEPGVLAANGIYDQPVSFAIPPGEQTERPVQLRGLVLSSTWDPSRWQVVAGREPLSADEVAVDAGAAVVGRAPLGSRPRLELPTGTRRVEVVGVVAAPGDPLSSDGAAGVTGAAEVAVASAHVVLPAAHAPALLGAVGKVDRVSVVAEPGTTPTDLADRLRDALPDGVTVTTVADRSQYTQHTVAALDSGLGDAVLGFALLTVAVSTLAVANVHTVLVAQRTRELGLLRLVGAGRMRLARLVLGEAALVGSAGALAGLGAGTVLAWAAVEWVRPVGVRGALVVTPAMLVAAVGVGLGVTLAGALVPAARAARAVPLDALSDTRAAADRPARWWVGASLAVGGLGGAALLLAGARPGFPTLVAAGAAAVAGLAGLALLSRAVVVPLTSLVSRPAVALGGVSARLGVGNVARRPGRTSAAASTLLVSLALVAVVATAGASVRAGIDEQFSNNGRAEMYLERRGLVRIDTDSLGRRLARRLRGIEGVAEVVAVEGVLEGPGGVQRRVVASGLDRVADMVDLDVVEGGPGDPDGRHAMVTVDTAQALGVGVGDTVSLRSTSGLSSDVEIVATYRNAAFVGPAVVGWPAVAAVDAEGTFELAAFDISERAPQGRVLDAARDVARGFPKLRVHTPEQFAELNRSVADTVLGVISVLLVGSVGIGFLGLASTLALSTLERRRELVMLRAVGAHRSQIRATVGLEAAVVGAIAALCGLAAGSVVGSMAARWAPLELVGDARVPAGPLALVGIAAVAGAWVVSLGVARRAALAPPAEAGQAD